MYGKSEFNHSSMRFVVVLSSFRTIERLSFQRFSPAAVALDTIMIGLINFFFTILHFPLEPLCVKSLKCI